MHDSKDYEQSAVHIRTRIKVPIRLRSTSSDFEPEIVTFAGLCDGLEHLALVFAPKHSNSTVSTLVRVHSECLTGDVLGSARCDCGLQLDEAISILGKNGGVLLYLRQEGRGIGLYNKLDAYFLQITRGLDTFAANRMLNFSDDLRDFRVAAQMLTALGINDISLITNNPDKVAQISKYGIKIKNILPTGVFMNTANEDYLRAKVRHHAHVIDLTKEQVPL